jgi:hypothetical protein
VGIAAEQEEQTQREWQSCTVDDGVCSR